MKANEAPEKIYIQPNAHDGWFETNNLNASLIEYTRTNFFIEKVINFLNYKLDDVVATRVPGTIIPQRVLKQELFEDFRKCMKGE